MNYYGGKDLAKAFRQVRNNTMTIAGDIPEDKYDFRPAPGSRTVAQTLIHIANGPSFQYHLHAEAKLSSVEGFDFMSFMEPIRAQEQQPHTKAQIIEKLTTGADQIETWMNGLTDEFLAETVSFPPPMTPPVKTRFEMIMSIKEHEMHHRGQLMVVERMLGITPHLTRAREANLERMRQEAAVKG